MFSAAIRRHVFHQAPMMSVIPGAAATTTAALASLTTTMRSRMMISTLVAATNHMHYSPSTTMTTLAQQQPGPTSEVSSSIQCQQVRHRSNRSRRGLYDGKDVRSGNYVSFSNKKTRRKFKPNVFLKSVYSETLNERIKFHLTAHTLRSIDNVGGLDNYLLKNTKMYTEGEGLKVRKRIEAEMKRAEHEQAYRMRQEARNAAKEAAAATTESTVGEAQKM